MSAHARCAVAIRKAMLLIAVGVCVLGVGCQHVQTIWSAKVRSPDGHWVAIARTIQHFGPGTAGIETIVYLKRNSSHPTAVCLFSHAGRNQSRSINLTTQSS